ncbi:MAG: MoaD/ThiS family protein [Candidatus Methanofastidiosia archaeon]
MRIKLRLLREGALREVEGEDISEILEKVGFNTSSVILRRNGEVIIEEEVLDGDLVEVIPVVSGG